MVNFLLQDGNCPPVGRDLHAAVAGEEHLRADRFQSADRACVCGIFVRAGDGRVFRRYRSEKRFHALEIVAVVGDLQEIIRPLAERRELPQPLGERVSGEQKPIFAVRDADDQRIFVVLVVRIGRPFGRIDGVLGSVQLERQRLGQRRRLNAGGLHCGGKAAVGGAALAVCGDKHLPHLGVVEQRRGAADMVAVVVRDDQLVNRGDFVFLEVADNLGAVVLLARVDDDRVRSGAQDYAVGASDFENLAFQRAYVGGRRIIAGGQYQQQSGQQQNGCFIYHDGPFLSTRIGKSPFQRIFIQNGSKLYMFGCVFAAQRAQISLRPVGNAPAFDGLLNGLVVRPDVQTAFADIGQRRVVLLGQRGRKEPCDHHAQIIFLRAHRGGKLEYRRRKRVVKEMRHQGSQPEADGIDAVGRKPDADLSDERGRAFFEHGRRNHIAGRPVIDIRQQRVEPFDNGVVAAPLFEQTAVQVVFLKIAVRQRLAEGFRLRRVRQLGCQPAQRGHSHADDGRRVYGGRQGGGKVAVGRVREREQLFGNFGNGGCLVQALCLLSIIFHTYGL